MAAFVGKWKQDDANAKNIEEFIKATGIPADAAKGMTETRYIVEFAVDGDKWKLTYTSTTEPITSSVFEYTLGVPYESMDMFGLKFKSVNEMISDTKIREKLTEWSGVAMEVIQEVQGDRLINTATSKGVQMTTFYTRM